MSLEKYNQVISKAYDVDITYDNLMLETYHRLCYICCVKDNHDIADIDKIFDFINVNSSFFSQLTENKELAAWINQHVFLLANSHVDRKYEDTLTYEDYQTMIVKDFDVENIEYQLLPEVLSSIPQHISFIVADLKMNIISHKCIFHIRSLKELAKKFAMKDLYDACIDLEIYVDYFDDMNEIIRLFQIVDIQAYQVLQIVRCLEKVE